MFDVSGFYSTSFCICLYRTLLIQGDNNHSPATVIMNTGSSINPMLAAIAPSMNATANGFSSVGSSAIMNCNIFTLILSVDCV